MQYENQLKRSFHVSNRNDLPKKQKQNKTKQKKQKQNKNKKNKHLLQETKCKIEENM